MYRPEDVSTSNAGSEETIHVVDEYPGKHEVPRRLLGAIALSRIPGPNMEHYHLLPKDYIYAEPGTIEPHELEALFQSVGMDQDLDAGRYETFEEQSAKLVEIGVRSVADNKLVGWGELVYIDDYQGTLGTLAVDPAHQRKGIGRAIIDQRITWAEALRLENLYIDDMKPTNTLRSYYEEIGFKDYEGVFAREMARSNEDTQ